MSKNGSKRSFIDSVEVKGPCNEDWNDMKGTDKVRFCSHCAKAVNNLSEMTRKEATRLVRSSGGKLCIRYHVDPVTRRPMFAEQLLQITRHTPRLTAGVMSASLGLSSMAYAQESPSPTATPIVTTSNSQPVRNSEENNVSNEIGTRELVELPIERTIMTTTMGVVSFSLRSEPENPLTQAVLNDDVDEVRELIAAGADVNGKEGNKRTPLFVAVEAGNVEIVRLLLDFGAKVNARDDEKRTPLMQLDDDATPELVDLLVSHGAKLNLTDDANNTALIIGTDSRIQSAVVEALIRAGADVRLANKEGTTALMNAADRDDVESVKLLVEAGADVNAKDDEGETAWDKTSDEEIEQYLVGHGAIVDIDEVSGDEPEPTT